MHWHPCASRACHNELAQGQLSNEVFKMRMTTRVHQFVEQFKKIPIVGLFAFVHQLENGTQFTVESMDKN